MLEIDLDGRVAVVTGGSRGIGRACVQTLARAGARCVIGHQDRERADEVQAQVEEIERLGGEALAYLGDLADPVNAQALLDAAHRKFGAVHIVVNNAGCWRQSNIETMTSEQLVETIDLNLKAAFRVTSAAARIMGKQVSGGSIIQIASTAGERGEARYSHYAATKGALVAMVKSIARELAPRIRANVVSPGWIETDMTAEALIGAQRRAVESSIPLGRIGQPQDVANMVAFLASDLAAWTTGAVYRVNGGGVIGEE